MTKMEPLTLILVRHAEAVAPKDGDGAESERDRPLTGRGIRDAETLAETLRAMKPDAIFSSPYRRAIQTVEPIARQHELPIELIEDLRERLLFPLALTDWKDHLQRSWRDFDYALPRGESSNLAQARVLASIEKIRSGRHSGVIVAASHGNLISLALHAYAPKIDFDFWAAMPSPAVYRLEYRDARWHVVEGPGI
ncbi:MAG TPA: histidine phosphatase family protein [Candidatus Binataceae bacterium]|nr:histidine phosphatase family protein [Candidatus Binataceae bacterium]